MVKSPKLLWLQTYFFIINETVLSPYWFSKRKGIWPVQSCFTNPNSLLLETGLTWSLILGKNTNTHNITIIQFNLY